MNQTKEIIRCNLNARKFPKGKLTNAKGTWEYHFHGSHCAFTHAQSGQEIEVSLVNRLEFGVLDPYFFTRFIKTSPDYQPIPIKFYHVFMTDVTYWILWSESVNLRGSSRNGGLIAMLLLQTDSRSILKRASEKIPLYMALL